MKIRNGFVSNSSSTSFTFCFKGKNIKDLTDLILTKYRDSFKRSYDEYHCNALDVVKAIEECIKECVSIDKVILDTMAILEGTLEYTERHKDKKDRYFIEMELRLKQELENKIEKLKGIREKGLNSVVIIGFGDNHGDVSGGNIGYAMDYGGRDIDINNDDLVVFAKMDR